MIILQGEGQCIQAIILVKPCEFNSNLVSVQAKEGKMGEETCFLSTLSAFKGEVDNFY